MLAFLALSAFASAANAGEGEERNVDTINGQAPPVCGVSATAPSQVLTVSLLNSDGFVDGPSVQSAIVQALNSAGVHAFCTGANNNVILTRTPFTRGGDGAAVGNFAQAVLYDVAATFTDEVADRAESTADGPAGATVANRFGPTGNGIPIVFANASGGGALAQPISVIVANPSDTGPSASFTNRPTARLVAGAYGSTLTLSLTPGL